MTERTIISPSTLGEPVGPFVRGVRAGNIVAISGTSALSHLSGPLEDRFLEDDFATQAELTFENLGAALATGGLGWADVLKMTVMLKRRADYAALNDIRGRILGGVQVASTTFICDLIRDDMLVEADALAIAPT